MSRLKKLRKMPAAEIVGRLAEVAHGWTDRCRYRLRRKQTRPTPIQEEAARQVALRAAQLLPGHQSGDCDRLKALSPSLHAEWSRDARGRSERILQGTWTLLGRPVDLRGAVDWHRDPGGDYAWPRSFYGAVDLLQSSEQVDVKYVWELSRHQFLAELGRDWLLGRNEAAASRARELLLDWIDQNPLYEGVNWTSALEAAMRGITWMWALASLAEWPGWQPGDLSAVATSLSEHAEFLSGHLSFYSSPYNHLIGEASGLVVIGAWLEGIDDRAPVWRRRGIEVLRAHARRQFYPDGFCVEQAMGYHFYTLGFLTKSAMLAQTAGNALAELQPTIGAAWRAGAALRRPDGTWPAFGDIDSARALPVYPENPWDFRGLCSLGAVLQSDSELAAAAEQPGQELFWALGMQGVERFQRLPVTQRPLRSVLPDSGYVVACSGKERHSDWVLFDCGPVGEGVHPDDTPSTAHGHADLLQVLFVQNGRALLEDGGMPCYFGPRTWERHFRSAGAHNTLEIDGLPTARPAGRLAWSHVRPPKPVEAVLESDFWWMRGAVVLDAGVCVTRELLGLPGVGLWIADKIEGASGQRCHWHWQYPQPTVPVVRTSAGSNLTWDLGDRIQCVSLWSKGGANPPNVSFQAGKEDEPAGWISKGYGEKEASCRATVSASAENRMFLLTYIGRPGVAGRFAAEDGNVECGDVDFSALGGRVETDQGVWTLALSGRRIRYVSGAARIADAS